MEKKSQPIKRYLIIGLALLAILLVGATLYFLYAIHFGEGHFRKSTVYQPEAYAVEGERANDQIVNILFLGIDKYAKITEARDSGSQGLSDAVYLLSYNLSENTVHALSIPRDTMVELNPNGYDIPYKGQITLQYAYGDTVEESTALSAKVVSDLLGGVPIHHVVSMNLDAVVDLNDAIGGVEVEALQDVYGVYHTFLEGDIIHLDGEQALDYVKTRDITVHASALDRIERQKQYLAAFMDKTFESIKKNPFLPIMMVSKAKDHLYTSLTTTDLLHLAGRLQKERPDVLFSQIDGKVKIFGEHEGFVANQKSIDTYVEKAQLRVKS